MSKNTKWITVAWTITGAGLSKKTAGHECGLFERTLAFPHSPSLFCLLWCVPRMDSFVIVNYPELQSHRIIGHRPRNATVVCLWPSSLSLSWCIPSPLFLFPCLFARCFIVSPPSLRLFPRVSMWWWLDMWWFLEISWACVQYTSNFSSLFSFLWVIVWPISRV